MLRRLVAVLAVAMLGLGVACSGDDGSGSGPTSSTGSVDEPSFAAQVASTDLAVGRDERFQVGVVSSTPDAGFQPLSFGSVNLSFAYMGGDGSAQAQPGPSVSATYLPAPGTDDTGTEPSLTNPSEARGVYQAEGLRFDQAGIWRVTVDADVAGQGPLSLEANFAVKTEPALPAPGDRALRTENLTMASKHVEPVAIDSRAQDDEPVPDPELHRWTIAEAIAQHRPALVLFATPVYCQSRFCGPDTEVLERLAKDYPDRAVFIHIEIYKEYNKSVVNQGAADWLYRDGDLTEPWLYLIGGNGTIADRWGPLFDPDEVAADLDRLPPMKS
jgi:hypothetical protein